MNTVRIYTRRMALYIKSKGINEIGVAQDKKKPEFINWIFVDTPELREAMDEYKNIFYRFELR